MKQFDYPEVFEGLVGAKVLETSGFVGSIFWLYLDEDRKLNVYLADWVLDDEKNGHEIILDANLVSREDYPKLERMIGAKIVDFSWADDGEGIIVEFSNQVVLAIDADKENYGPDSEMLILLDGKGGAYTCLPGGRVLKGSSSDPI